MTHTDPYTHLHHTSANHSFGSLMFVNQCIVIFRACHLASFLNKTHAYKNTVWPGISVSLNLLSLILGDEWCLIDLIKPKQPKPEKPFTAFIVCIHIQRIQHLSGPLTNIEISKRLLIYNVACKIVYYFWLTIWDKGAFCPQKLVVTASASRC